MKFFDLQVNGYAGADFSSPRLTPEALHTACETLRDDGVDQILATIITRPLNEMEAALRNLVRLREADPLVERLIAGIHIEGPFLNSEPGYVGAHSPDAVRAACPEVAKKLLEAAGGLTQVFTLAPEVDQGARVISFLREQRVVPSAGHSNASLEELKEAIDHGLAMVTHLGNGCPMHLPRHDNIIQRLLSLRHSLWFGFIADGHHVELPALKNYLDLVGADRSFLVTDAISAATLGPGLHELAGMAVEVDVDGVARRPGSDNLAGSTLRLPDLIQILRNDLGLSHEQMKQLMDRNPRHAIGMQE
ncbi:MAG: N-acetylglucosamine-6-phosphate deacetylase [Verrucomicrobiota bacterium]